MAAVLLNHGAMRQESSRNLSLTLVLLVDHTAVRHMPCCRQNGIVVSNPNPDLYLDNCQLTLTEPIS